MWKYCGNISQLWFFILYIISPFSHFISSIRFSFLFFLFSCFPLPHTLSYLYPPLLLFSSLVKLLSSLPLCFHMIQRFFSTISGFSTTFPRSFLWVYDSATISLLHHWCFKVWMIGISCTDTATRLHHTTVQQNDTQCKRQHSFFVATPWCRRPLLLVTLLHRKLGMTWNVRAPLYITSFFLFFFFAFIVMIWLILKLCFWVCILIIWLCLNLEMFERKIVVFIAVVFVAMRGERNRAFA